MGYNKKIFIMCFIVKFWSISRNFSLKNGDVVNYKFVSYNILMWNDQQS